MNRALLSKEALEYMIRRLKEVYEKDNPLMATDDTELKEFIEELEASRSQFQ